LYCLWYFIFLFDRWAAQVSKQTGLVWPSGDCKPIIATLRTPVEPIVDTDATIFRDKDDLDWFEGAYVQIDGLGTVLIMKYDNNPSGLTALYVDASCHVNSAATLLVQFFGLSPKDVKWQTKA
jgi:hypothetical protein